MMDNYIQLPYIVLPCGLVKPALIITIMYLFVLIGFILYGIHKKTLKITNRSINKQGEINKIILYIVEFTIMIPLCIIMQPFFAETEILVNLSKNYLMYEPFLFLGIFLFLCTAALNRSNHNKQIEASNKFLSILILCSIGTGLLTEQIDYKIWANIVIIFLAIVLISLYLIFDIESNNIISINSDKFDMVSYKPVENIDELFPIHKIQSQEISNIILNSSFEPFSICISGEWGTGKTSVVNGIINTLKSKKENTYDFIFINALEIDNKSSMVKYLFSQIENRLKSHGVYVGVDSEFKNFISSSISSFTSSTIGTLIHKKYFSDNEDYRFQKNN